MFFDQNFSFKLNWNLGFPLSIAALKPKNKQQLARGLQLMSQESIRYRFQAAKKAFTETELDYLTSIDGLNHFALGIEEDNSQRRGIAVIRMVRSIPQPREAEVAVTIIDEYQKKGLGSLLMDLIVLAAFERELDQLAFTFIPQNEGIVKLIKRLGTPISRVMSADHAELILKLKDIDLEKVKKRVAPFLPEIETDYLKT